jgi:hypothetical protein
MPLNTMRVNQLGRSLAGEMKALKYSFIDLYQENA